MELKKVLVVEDDNILALFYKSLLKRMGYNVVGVINNSNAVSDAVQKFMPDILLMDVKIAGDKDGIDMAMELRKITEAPILFTTGNSEPDTMMRAKAIANAKYLLKPIMENDLREAFAAFNVIA